MLGRQFILTGKFSRISSSDRIDIIQHFQHSVSLKQNLLRIGPITHNEWLYILILAAPNLLAMGVLRTINKSKTNEHQEVF